MVDIFTGHFLVNRDGQAVDPEQALQNKIVGLYFSAAWCSLCRDFTPILCDFYSELVEDAPSPAPFEIVFVSSDRSREEMVDYMQNMHGEWLAVPFQDTFKHELKKRYNITAIPKLVIVKQTGEVITDKGRKQIRERGLNCFRNWLEGADIFQNFCS
ncbi:nucleoredoxin-like protein 2 isoform X2 [Podarcis muralis]|uniref:Nucleoredoxin like 2 n=2 Tax=Podarcis TaxID=42163 RepID=A0A670JMI8_PODMU|nr:nucleoredoxin-like protein 2 [Podarcis muralis]XP_028604991.1 nucleoredoxin-like protein 2 [Podarcis muralis]XP_053265050.1 nucleoredoxin-like protein 2 [Podarcis raffonei]CAI5787008.1 Thioredoxin domain-containing protein [Podarcis lilfordi]